MHAREGGNQRARTRERGRLRGYTRERTYVRERMTKHWRGRAGLHERAHLRKSKEREQKLPATHS